MEEKNPVKPLLFQMVSHFEIKNTQLDKKISILDKVGLFYAGTK
jgi:hypothetical protein